MSSTLKLKQMLNLPICIVGLDPIEVVKSIMDVIGIKEYRIMDYTKNYMFIEDSKAIFLLEFIDGDYHCLSLCSNKSGIHPYPNFPFQFKIQNNTIDFVSGLKRSHSSL